VNFKSVPKIKKILKKKYYKYLTIFNQNGSQMAISKGKFLGGYLLAISIFLGFILTIVWQNATINKLNYNIAILQQKKFNLVNTKNMLSAEITKLEEKDRIISLGKKMGLILPEKNYVVLYHLNNN